MPYPVPYAPRTVEEEKANAENTHEAQNSAENPRNGSVAGDDTVRSHLNSFTK